MKDGVGVMIPFPSIWGHWAGGPGDSKEDVKWLDEKLRQVGLGDSEDEVEWLTEIFRTSTTFPGHVSA